MKTAMLFILVGMITLPFVAGGQETYQWVDEKGTVHFTDDISQVPEKYQDQVKKRKAPPEPKPSPVPKPSPSIRIDRDRVPPEPEAEKKDILGRGEEWWRDKASEWNEKLKNAKKNYDAAQAAVKEKQKELEQSIYKPHSFRRKLEAEIKVLEDRVNEQKKQMDEAKNMLEQVLPKQAEEYRADPSWVKVE